MQSQKRSRMRTGNTKKENPRTKKRKGEDQGNWPGAPFKVVSTFQEKKKISGHKSR